MTTLGSSVGYADGPVGVGPDELLRVDRGEFQRGWNRGDERVRALALGAPLACGDQPKLRDCPTCGERTTHSLARASDETAVVATCETCDTETGRWYRGSMPGDP